MATRKRIEFQMGGVIQWGWQKLKEGSNGCLEESDNKREVEGVLPQRGLVQDVVC